MAEQRVNIQVYRPDGTMIAQYLLGEGEHLIGREYGCPIYLESDYISSQHAKLQLAADGIHIEDLNSTSGTFLDGVTVRGKLRIKPGQVLQVGDLTINLQPESEDQIGPGSRLGGGRYTLVKLLGRGGMGEVWLAQDGQLDEQVALKRLPSEMGNDPVAIADLKREVQKSRLLSHRNIIRIHDLYQQPGEDALVSLEYVDGTDLSALANTKTDRIFTWEEIKPLIVQLCEALDHAHEEKIVHRDLKPANMMMTREGKLKLADFGIAATMADSLSRSSMRDVISGTSLYMSPQQMEGEVPRASDDIYAFGATIYELLTSRQPFYTGDIQHQVLNVIPKPMDQRLAEFGLSNPVPDYVHQLVMSCLTKDEEGRPASAAGIRDWINSEGKMKGVLGKTSTKTMRRARPQPAEMAVASSQAEEEQRKRKAPLIAVIAGVAALAIGLGIRFPSGGKENTGSGTTSTLSNSFINTLGMKFVPVPGTKVQFCIWETRVKDYAAYAAANARLDASWKNPGYVQADTHPVVRVSWNHAQAFCAWLTKKELAAGTIKAGQRYRLPTDTEWSVAVGLSNEPGNTPEERNARIRDVYPWGNKSWPPPKGAGNYIQELNVDPYLNTSPVGSFDSNKYGIYDLDGNVREWVEDWHDPAAMKWRVMRGACWKHSSQIELFPSYRIWALPYVHFSDLGFRCVLTDGSGTDKDNIAPRPNSSKAKAAIEAAIRKAAGKPRGKLTRVDLEKVTRLELPAMQLTDASALAGLTKLRLLKVNNNNLSNDQLKHMARLASLEWLDISHNRLTDVSALVGLTNLKRLYLDGNKLTDVSPLIKLTQLEGLYLASNQLTDVSALAGLAKLDKLDLRSNRNLTRGVYQKLQKALPKCTIYVNGRGRKK